MYIATGNPTSVDRLCDVISSHKDYITMTTKGDISAGEVPPKDDVIATDEQKVSNNICAQGNVCKLKNNFCRLRDWMVPISSCG